MKNFIIGISILAVSTSACNSGNDSSGKNIKTADSTQRSITSGKADISTPDSKVDASMKEMVAQYLQMKNALVNDNGKQAASAGNAFVEAMSKMDIGSLTADKKKKWNELADDAKEMAEHIGKNGDRIAHQREHFDMLSKDMYDMVKAFGAGQILYNDFCPIYNDKVGATWLSETKDIRNPYLGKSMPTCGSVKEEIK